MSASAQMTEETARQAAQELRVLVTEGTGVIGDLQPAINGSKTTKEQVSPDALVNAFKARYQKASGNAFDPKATGIIGDTRRAYLQSFTSVVTRFQGNLTKGGQDAFVPAFFRAQTLNDFNKIMHGKVQGYATNRDNELIITGTGESWLGGAEASSFAQPVSDWHSDLVDEQYNDGIKLLERLVLDIDVPTIAAINGPGPRLELPLLCDLTLSTADVVLGDGNFRAGSVPGNAA